MTYFKQTGAWLITRPAINVQRRVDEREGPLISAPRRSAEE
jgi:hypothetical protein